MNGWIVFLMVGTSDLEEIDGVSSSFISFRVCKKSCQLTQYWLIPGMKYIEGLHVGDSHGWNVGLT